MITGSKIWKQYQMLKIKSTKSQMMLAETKYSFLYSIYHAIIGLIVPRPKGEKVEVAQRHTQIRETENGRINIKRNNYVYRS